MGLKPVGGATGFAFVMAFDPAADLDFAVSDVGNGSDCNPNSSAEIDSLAHSVFAFDLEPVENTDTCYLRDSYNMD